MHVSLIAVAPQTVSEHTQCRYMTPWFLELVSPDPALRRSDSPPLSSAGNVETEKKKVEGNNDRGEGDREGEEGVSVVRK